MGFVVGFCLFNDIRFSVPTRHLAFMRSVCPCQRHSKVISASPQLDQHACILFSQSCTLLRNTSLPGSHSFHVDDRCLAGRTSSSILGESRSPRCQQDLTGPLCWLLSFPEKPREPVVPDSGWATTWTLTTGGLRDTTIAQSMCETHSSHAGGLPNGSTPHFWTLHPPTQKFISYARQSSINCHPQKNLFGTGRLSPQLASSPFTKVSLRSCPRQAISQATKHRRQWLARRDP